jgi:hypothetical protein
MWQRLPVNSGFAKALLAVLASNMGALLGCAPRSEATQPAPDDAAITLPAPSPTDASELRAPPTDAGATSSANDAGEAADAGDAGSGRDAGRDAALLDAGAVGTDSGACGVCDRVWVCNGFSNSWASEVDGGRCVNQRNGVALRCDGVLDGALDGGVLRNVGTWSGDARELELRFRSLGDGLAIKYCYPP